MLATVASKALTDISNLKWAQFWTISHPFCNHATNHLKHHR